MSKLKRVLGLVLGELAPWLYFAVASAFFAAITLFGATTIREIWWGLALSFLCWIFFLVLYGRVLCHKTSKTIVCLVSLPCFLLMGVAFSCLNVVLLLSGAFSIVMGVCVLVCVNSWLFRFRGGRIVGLLIVFVSASVL